MRRREVLAGAVGLFVPVAVAAQEPGRTYRIGVVSPNARSLETIRDLTLPELARLGFEEGHNLVLDLRDASENSVQGIVEDVIRARPDVIVAITNRMAGYVQRATNVIPIIMYGGDDPVARGLAPALRGQAVTPLALPSCQSPSTPSGWKSYRKPRRQPGASPCLPSRRTRTGKTASAGCASYRPRRASSLLSFSYPNLMSFRPPSRRCGKPVLKRWRLPPSQASLRRHRFLCVWPAKPACPRFASGGRWRSWAAC